MGRGTEQPITCATVGCGFVYTHKRMDSKGWQRERLLHVASGQCAKRVNETAAAEVESRQGGGVTMKEVLDLVSKLVDPMYDLIRVQDAKHEELKQRVEKRLESRKKRKFYIERDSKPKPWKMRVCIKQLLLVEDLPVVEKFKETMTKEYEHGWTWQLSLGAWFHWLLDQCSADPILLMSKDSIRFHDESGSKNVTKLQFFRCFGRFTKWDPLDEGLDGFFVGFWYPLVTACRDLTHWDNRIIFDLPCSEQQKRTFDDVWLNGFNEMREPNLSRDRAIAQVFYDVLAFRRANRREQRMEEEKTQ